MLDQTELGFGRIEVQKFVLPKSYAQAFGCDATYYAYRSEVRPAAPPSVELFGIPLSNQRAQCTHMEKSVTSPAPGKRGQIRVTVMSLCLV